MMHLLTQRCTLKNPVNGPYVAASQEYGTNAVLEDVQRMYQETTWAESATDVPCRLSHGGGDSVLVFLPFGTAVGRNWVIVIEGVIYHVTSVDPNPGQRAHHVEASCEEVWPS